MRSSTLCDALRCGRCYALSHSRPGASHSIRTSLRYFSGHAFLNDVTDEESFHGWLAAPGFNVSDPLAIAVEFGRHAKDLDALDLGIAEVSISSFMVGPGYALRRSPRFTPFARR